MSISLLVLLMLLKGGRLSQSPPSFEPPRSPPPPLPQEEEISEELIERTRSNSLSFRDQLEGIEEGKENSDGSRDQRKSIYLPVSAGTHFFFFFSYVELINSIAAVKLKILIPDLQATKLMKFDPSTRVKDVIR